MKHEKFYLKLQINSIIERDVVYFPRHCFFIVSLPQIFAGYAYDLGVFGIWVLLFRVNISFLFPFMNFLMTFGFFA